MNLLIDECLHTSLIAVAQAHGHLAQHVAWIGLSGETDWALMERVRAEDLTLVTNNARDFRKLFAREPIHAGLILILPQVPPARQRELLDIALTEIGAAEMLVNEAIEIDVQAGAVVISRLEFPVSGR